MDVDLGNGLHAIAERLSIQSGDVVLLRCTRPLDSAELEQMREAGRGALPEGATFIVIDDEALRLEKLDPEDARAVAARLLDRLDQARRPAGSQRFRNDLRSLAAFVLSRRAIRDDPQA